METHDTVGMLIEKDGKVLLIERLNEPNIGFWALPGGHVDEGESLEETVDRETHEEISGAKIAGKMKLVFEYTVDNGDSHYDKTHRHICHMFRGIAENNIVTGSDAGDQRWIKIEDAIKLENITESSRRILKLALKEM